MSSIRGKNTKPELLIRKALHARGYRYRLHARDLPGKPDLVLPKWKAVILVHGCFWHGHNCHLFKMPSTRTAFWSEKIRKNRERDEVVQRELREAGWRMLAIWECAIKGRARLEFEDLMHRICSWIRGSESEAVIEGTR